MKLFAKRICGMLCAALLVSSAMVGCQSKDDTLYYRYDYDLSEYIDLGTYSDIPATASDVSITDDEVEMQIQSTLSYYAGEEEVDTPAAFGNVVYFDADVTLNGDTLSEYAVEEGSLTLGFGTYGEDIDNALTGCLAGDTITATRTLPDSTEYGDYAGATLDYAITVERVCRTEIPELTDLYAQTVLNFDSAEAYRTAVREAMEASAKSNRDALILSQVWPKLVEETTVKKYPEKELTEIRNQINMEIDSYINAVGIDRDTYIELKYNMTADEFEAYVEELSKDQVKEEMIVYAIARAENIEVTDEDYATYAAIYASNYGYDTVEDMENAFGKQVVRAGVLSDVTKAWVGAVKRMGKAKTAAENPRQFFCISICRRTMKPSHFFTFYAFKRIKKCLTMGILQVTI